MTTLVHHPVNSSPLPSKNYGYIQSGRDQVDNKDKDEPRIPDFMQQDSQNKPAIPPPTPPSSQPMSVTPSDGLNKEVNRLATFTRWPVAFIDKNRLAMIGFYYIGPSDIVKCFFCGLEIGSWEPDDDLVEEHLKHMPGCRLLRGRETSNEPIDAEALKRILPQISYDTCGIMDIRPDAYVESPPSSSASSLNSQVS